MGVCDRGLNVHFGATVRILKRLKLMFNSIISSIHFIAATRYQFRKCVNFAHVDVKRGLFVTPLLPGVVCDTEFVRATFHCADDNYFKWTAYICGKISNPEIAYCSHSVLYPCTQFRCQLYRVINLGFPA